MTHIYCCVACGCLAHSERADAVTCCPACRAWVHRHPENLEQLKRIADAFEVPVSMIPEVRAACCLLSAADVQAVESGTASVTDARIRDQVERAFLKLVFQAVHETPPTSTPEAPRHERQP